MTALKSFTDIPQSKKLAEILPLESADMWWLYITAQGKYIAMMHEEPDPHYLTRMESYGIKDAAIRCWSLAALLGVLPDTITSNDGIAFELNIKKDIIEYSNPSLYLIYKSVKADNLIDACVEMIERLHELNLL